MKCPIDGTNLLMMDRLGVEIDYCPECRGVWLDRGELDKIIEKATPAVVLPDPDPTPEPAASPAAPDPIWAEEPRSARHDDKRYKKPSRKDRRRYDDDDDDDDDDEYRYAKRFKRKRGKSILSEIFDFD